MHLHKLLNSVNLSLCSEGSHNAYLVLFSTKHTKMQSTQRRERYSVVEKLERKAVYDDSWRPRRSCFLLSSYYFLKSVPAGST